MVERRRLREETGCPSKSKGRPRKPLVYRGKGDARLVDRRALLRALADEYEQGNSRSKLYVALLIRAVLDQDPRLTRKPDDPRVLKLIVTPSVVE